jgi:sugar phosphate isomerase/epimerase
MLNRKNTPVYVSTTAIGSENLETIVKKFNKHGIRNIELSYGIFERGFEKSFKKLYSNNNFIFHNYFPKPEKDFVINLASFNKEIRAKSLQFIKKNIDFSGKYGMKYYSFHAGFLIDPKPKSLGKIIPKVLVQQRRKTIKVFISSIIKLSKYAKIKNVKLFIENNVISKANLQRFKKNPLLMTEPKEIKNIMSKLPNNVDLLMDVAHFKVSSETLKFDLTKSFKDLKKFIGAYHLSDNNGIIDNNKDIRKNSWFINLMSRVDFISIEVANKNLKKIKTQLNLIQKKISHIDEH